MPRPRSEMRRIREVMRLYVELGDNHSAIAAASGVSRSTVRRYLERAALAQLDMATALARCPMTPWRRPSFRRRSRHRPGRSRIGPTSTTRWRRTQNPARGCADRFRSGWLATGAARRPWPAAPAQDLCGARNIPLRSFLTAFVLLMAASPGNRCACHPCRCRSVSARRKARATMVMVGVLPPLVGKTELPAM